MTGADVQAFLAARKNDGGDLHEQWCLLEDLYNRRYVFVDISVLEVLRIAKRKE